MRTRSTSEKEAKEKNHEVGNESGKLNSKSNSKKKSQKVLKDVSNFTPETKKESTRKKVKKNSPKKRKSEQISKEAKEKDKERNSNEQGLDSAERTIPEKKRKNEWEQGAPAPSQQAIFRLQKELKKILPESHKHGIRLEDTGNILKVALFICLTREWSVEFFDFDPNSSLYESLTYYASETGRDNVKLEVNFPPSYPSSPPFIRIVYPRFHQYTGHITVGGSLCIKDLTASGWNPNYELLPFLIMLRNLLLEGGAIVNMDNTSDYTEEEARQAFLRVAAQHGWQVGF